VDGASEGKGDRRKVDQNGSGGLRDVSTSSYLRTVYGKREVEISLPARSQGIAGFRGLGDRTSSHERLRIKGDCTLG